MSAEMIGKNVKSFVIKSVQCIVESRLGGSKVRTVGRPTGQEWFYIALNDYPDVTETAKRALQAIVDECEDISVNLQLVQIDWRVCCEILLKTNDSETITLEYWTIENRSLTDDRSIASSSIPDRSSTLFQSYNQMSILLKSIISLSRALPAHKITENQSAESYVICYRVYKCDQSLEKLLDKEDANCYSGPHRVGSVRTEHNVLCVNTAYRTEMRGNRNRSHSKDANDRPSFVRNDSITSTTNSPEPLQLKSDYFTAERKKRNQDRPLFAAFATTPSELISFPQLADDAFNTLLPSNRNDDFSMDQSTCDTNHSTSSSDRSRSIHCRKDDHVLSTVHSDPISIPDSKQSRPSALNCERLPSTESIAAVSQSPAIAAPSSCNKGFSHLSCSPGCSSLDSFVFVDLKPPFAPDDQSELGSFFNGPSPSFGDCSLAEEMEDLTDQLALMESNAQQWDQFVDSINLKSDDENE